jgi:uncharacterized protein YggE
MKQKIALLLVGSALLLTGGLLTGCEDGVVLGEDGDTNCIISQQNLGIWVNGQGTVTAVPDVAVLTLGVEVEAATVEEAQAQAAASMNAVIAALKANGVDESDIQTRHFNIYTVRNYDEGKQEIVAYRVTNTVTVNVRDVDETGTVIDAAVAAGGNDIRVNNIYFTIDDTSAYQDEARELAVADAKAKAQQLAELAGVSLGKVTYISESGTSIPPIYYDSRAAEDGASATPISPGELEVTVSVQVVYSID